MTTTEIKNLIIEFAKKNDGINRVNYDTVGGYDAAEPVYKQMIADGELVWVKVPSKSGKRMMTKLALKEYAGRYQPAK